MNIYFWHWFKITWLMTLLWRMSHSSWHVTWLKDCCGHPFDSVYIVHCARISPWSRELPYLPSPSSHSLPKMTAYLAWCQNPLRAFMSFIFTPQWWTRLIISPTVRRRRPEPWMGWDRSNGNISWRGKSAISYSSLALSRTLSDNTRRYLNDRWRRLLGVQKLSTASTT